MFSKKNIKNLCSLLIIFAIVGLAVMNFLLSPVTQRANASSSSMPKTAGDIESRLLTFPGTGVGEIPDGLSGTPPQFGAPLTIKFEVSGVHLVNYIALDITMTHTWVGDLEIILRSPNGTVQHSIVNRIGVTTAGNHGDSSDFGGTYVFHNAANGNIWTAATASTCGTACVIAPGSYSTTSAGSGAPTNFLAAFSGLTAIQANGTWTLTIRDAATSDIGAVTAANLFFQGGDPPTPTPTPRRSSAFDFDGDRKADIAVFRPSNGYWHISKSSGGYSSIQWGISSDTPVAGDYDGDGKTDLAVYRVGVINQSNRDSWYILKSSDNTYIVKEFGESGSFTVSFPAAPADYDGDGKTDMAVVKRFFTSIPFPDNFLVAYSSTGAVVEKVLDTHYDRVIRSADYDGDGKADLALVSNGVWSILKTSDGATRTEHFGLSSDKYVPADYDGDRRADIAVWRPSNGYWYRINSRDNSFTAVQFGSPSDNPMPDDYDGDGKTDIAVFRPSNGMWYLQQSSAGFRAEQFGTSTDIPIR